MQTIEVMFHNPESEQLVMNLLKVENLVGAPVEIAGIKAVAIDLVSEAKVETLKAELSRIGGIQVRSGPTPEKPAAQQDKARRPGITPRNPIR